MLVEDLIEHLRRHNPKDRVKVLVHFTDSRGNGVNDRNAAIEDVIIDNGVRERVTIEAWAK